MIIDEENFEEFLTHYGTPRHSGRYPWGSGGDEPARSQDFIGYVDDLRKKGMSEVEIAKGMGISVARLRARRSIANHEIKGAQITQARRLKDHGNSNVAIGKIMGLNESSVRALLKDGEEEKANIIQTISGTLKSEVNEKGLIDIGTGVENHLGVSSTRLHSAVALLQEQGYEVHNIPIRQLGTGKNTTTKVLAPPGTTWGDAVKRRDQISQLGQVTSYSDDGGRTFNHVQDPIKIDPKRVAVNYGSEGGAQADGVIYVRPGIKDLSLGKSSYAQVRIAVGDGHYLKGMAMYKDDLPPGKDLLFNTNKENTGNHLDAMKKITDDPERPFGSVVRQIHNEDGSVSSAMNIVHEEGSWQGWSKTISTQMLSKQSPKLAKSQLDMTYEQHIDEYDRLSKLTNPTVKKMLLEKFGDETDASAVHLDAAGLNRRQSWHVILPIETMPPTHVYAPNFRDGERVVLIRFPHAGTFEIPELTVNNSHPEAKKLLGAHPRDAVGINHSVAERLSGADFDGDTVLVIPNNQGKVKVTPALEGLKNFDPRSTYKAYEGMPRMTAKQKGLEMGGISNLITDMTLRGASTAELARAVKHSMVVIDAEKHHLNYKQSAIDNGIAALKEKYQGKKNAGASTLISRATAELRVPQRKPRPAALGGPIDKKTGERVFVPTGKTDFRTGKPALEKSTRLGETTDAHTLSSGTPMERLYADHSNKLKTLANRARKDSVNIPPAKYSPSAKKVYTPQVKSLDAKLFIALRNAPLERQAQVLGNAMLRARLDANPNLDKETVKKLKGQSLELARTRLGAKKQQIVITPEEWNAIQAGAISDHKLRRILQNADLDTVRKLATPKPEFKMTPTKTARAEAMLAAGFTRAQVADQLGVSLTTLDNATVGDT